MEYLPPGIPTTIKTMDVNIATISYLRILIIMGIGSTIILMGSLNHPKQVTKNGQVCIHMGVSKNSGTPKWMVYNGKPY